MNWQKLTKENKPPYEKNVLVDFGKNNYAVTHLLYDDEFQCDLWLDFEGYSNFVSVKHFCYIDTP